MITIFNNSQEQTAQPVPAAARKSDDRLESALLKPTCGRLCATAYAESEILTWGPLIIERASASALYIALTLLKRTVFFVS